MCRICSQPRRKTCSTKYETHRSCSPIYDIVDRPTGDGKHESSAIDTCSFVFDIDGKSAQSRTGREWSPIEMDV